MAATPYYATYCRFQTVNKNIGAHLLGADNLVGDSFDIEFQDSENDQVPWLRNRFGELVGYLDKDIAHELLVCQAKSWQTYALFASAYYTESPEPGSYWGEVVIMAYSPDVSEAFNRYRDGVAAMLGEGIRPNVVLNSQEIQKILDCGGDWRTSDRRPKLDVPRGTALVKDHRTLNENLIEKIRQRKIGYMVGGWVCMIAVIVVIVLLFRSCNGF